jgi:hypothetical protein
VIERAGESADRSGASSTACVLGHVFFLGGVSPCRYPEEGAFMVFGYPQENDGYTVFTVALPEDSHLPRRGHAAPPRSNQRPLCQPYYPASGPPGTEEECLTWFRWVVGHQHLFLYWSIQADVCRRVSRALQSGQTARAVRLLDVATALRWGEIAAMLNCGSLPPERYQAFLRPQMEAVRADFSARSAHDYLVLERALDQLRKDLRQLKNPDDRLARARQAFLKSCTQWRERHIEVAERLQPGVSLAVLEYQRLRDQGLGLSFPQYVDQVIQSREALAVYDRFFGVQRVRMSLEEFAETAVWVLGQIHRILALPREQLKWVLRGDHLLIAIIDRLLCSESASAV